MLPTTRKYGPRDWAGVVEVAPKIDADERRARLYSGAVIVEPGVDGATLLGQHAWTMLVECLAPHDPMTVHEVLSPDELSDLLIGFKPAFIHHPRSKELVAQMLDELGFDLDRTYFEVPKPRTSYPTDHLTTGIAYAFQTHRDTWYAAPPQQINIWLPVQPVSKDDAMLFYPDGFGSQVPNNSDGYNYYVYNSHRGNIKQFSGAKDTRVHPAPNDGVPLGATITVLPPAGGLMMFSGDQLHASIPNTTNRARYSIDFRIVDALDVEAQIGAPCADVACEGTALRDFIRATDHQRLDEALIERYDVDPDRRTGVLVYGQ